MGSSQRTRTKNEKKAGSGTRVCFCVEVWHVAGCSPWARRVRHDWATEQRQHGFVLDVGP